MKNKIIIGVFLALILVISVFSSAGYIDVYIKKEKETQSQTGAIFTINEKQDPQKVAKVRIKYFVHDEWNKDLADLTKKVNDTFKDTNITFVWDTISHTLGDDNWTKNENDLLKDLRNRPKCSEGVNVVFAPNGYLDYEDLGGCYTIICNGVRNIIDGGVIVNDTCNLTQIARTVAHELLHALGLSHDEIKWKNPDTEKIEPKTENSTLIDNNSQNVGMLPKSKPCPPHGYGFYDMNGDCHLNESDGEWKYKNNEWDIDCDCNFSHASDKEFLLYGSDDATNDQITQAQIDYIYQNAIKTPGTRVDEVCGPANPQKQVSSGAASDKIGDMSINPIDLKGTIGQIYWGNEEEQLLRISSTFMDNESFHESTLWAVEHYIDADNWDGSGDVDGFDYKIQIIVIDTNIHNNSMYEWIGGWKYIDPCGNSTLYTVSRDTYGHGYGRQDYGKGWVVSTDIAYNRINWDLYVSDELTIKTIVSGNHTLYVKCGDVDYDDEIDLQDVVYLLNYVNSGGPPPMPYLCVGDVNCDGLVDMDDVIYLTNFYEGSGPPPCNECCQIEDSDEGVEFSVSKIQGYLPTVYTIPCEGLPGSNYYVGGDYFTPESDVNIYFDYELVGTISTDLVGSFMDFDAKSIPQVGQGLYPVTCVDTNGEFHMKYIRVLSSMICGDLNEDQAINIADLTYLVAYLFGGGPSPQPTDCVADVNCDYSVNIADLTYIVAYLFGGGPAPCTDCCNPQW